MIERGQVDRMPEKLDIFFAANKLTEAEYTELTGLLTNYLTKEAQDGV
jgi:hypothetical protein